ncbi:NAD(P)/FAD-dependent oxidoreductase [Trinickia fusca]|uniref:NAD(P)/FAD-dependent oxidoreductase n=1 Tax=Trinickia fusca TaxID=2419777 RepID=A0A494X760_9BURK|nr:FAD/NAD(P)-binding oxidoreductase [Trinickia fusca]RKP43839.1 NAD(P)/FAD-dependent oxidoreductase [Trinickia fusca]
MTMQHFDVVVIGAGPAGLAAVQAAASSGARIALVDDNPRAGGQVWRQGPGRGAAKPLQDMLTALDAQAGLTIFSSTRVIAAAPAKTLLLESSDQGGVHLSYERLIVCTGARERLLPCRGWTLPGVTGAGGLQALIKGGVPVGGQRIVIGGSGPLLIAALATAREAGARVLAVVEHAPRAAVARFGLSLAATPSKLWQAARLTRGFGGVPYWTDSVVREVRGNGRVEAVTIARGTREMTLACDRVALGYGLVPNLTLAQALGCAVEAEGIVVDDLQRTSVDDVLAAGECTGIGGVELATAEGAIAGCIAGKVSVPAQLVHERTRWRRFAARVERGFALGEAARAWPTPDTLLCRCEDVPFGEVAAHGSWRDAKLHTRCGMGACQGRICGTAAQTLLGWDMAAPRPPLAPTRIETLLAACAHEQHLDCPL